MSIPLEEQLCNLKIDGWLITDFEGVNVPARGFLGITEDHHISRRFFYWIGADGKRIKLVSAIEDHVLDHLDGETRLYLHRKDLDFELDSLLKEKKQIAMEYVEDGLIPYISKVDAGTIERIRKRGVKIVSSAPILQYVTSRLTNQEYQSHIKAAKNLEEIFVSCWKLIGERSLTYEGDVIEHILESIDKRDLITEHTPICAVGLNSANPHYQCKGRGSPITEDSIIMIDMWAKLSQDNSIFADFTQMGFFGDEPTDEMKNVFSSVREAQKQAIAFIKSKALVSGYEVDDVAMTILKNRGYESNIRHRTGHNIHKRLHGPGTNLDGFETFDQRKLIPLTLYSVEPALYLPGKFGVRLEVNIFIDENSKVIVSGKEQEKLITL